MNIRPYRDSDADRLWQILEPVLRAGDTYALPRDWARDEALAYWLMPGHEVFVAGDGDDILGTYYLQANQKGGGARVANCGYVTAANATGRGVARAMCGHSIDHARDRGFRAMQFNFVVSTNIRAVRLWQALGFEIVGTLPRAFDHPREGEVDALVMYRFL
jgi:ribosomal protein S18 acetylase RimI-like enzyme